MGKIKELLIKYKELVLYVVFGVLTTVVSYVSYWIFTQPVPGIDSAFVGAFSYLCVCDEPQVGV